jgi:mycofactocin system creatininase family protein
VSWLGDLTSDGARDAALRGAVLAVPVGSTEQHGPHLPLSTDTDIAVALCALLAARRDIVIAPPVAYGSSGEHEGFAGTVSIGQAATELLVVELCRSATGTFSGVVLVSGHGGNAAPLARAVAVLRAEGRDVLAWSPHWDGDPHAGAPETSMQLALRPQLVRMSLAAPGDTRPLRDVLPDLIARGVRAVSANGVLGDPTGASAGDGRALLGSLADELVCAVDAWRSRVLSP